MRIYSNYRPLSRLRMDLKVMPNFNKGHKYILCIIDKVTNYLITIPIHQSRSDKIGDALKENIITKYFFTRLHNNGSGQCVYVFTHDLVILRN